MIAGILTISLMVLYIYLLSISGNDPDSYLKKSGAILVTSKKIGDKIILNFEIVRDSFYHDRIERNLVKRWIFKPYCKSEVHIHFDSGETKELFVKCGLLEKIINDAWHGLMSVEVSAQEEWDVL